jgi:hypothetical protein
MSSIDVTPLRRDWFSKRQLVPARSAFLAFVALGAICFFAPLSQGQDERDSENDGVCSSVRRWQRCDSIEEAVEKAEAALDEEKCRRDTALIYVARTANDRRVNISSELHYVGGKRGGYVPGSMFDDEIILRLIPNVRSTQAVELRLMAPGFETYKLRAILRPGDILIWDDILLEPLTRYFSASIMGRVWLEDDADTDGMVISVNGEDTTFTDDSGYFVVEAVSSGELRVSTYKHGYTGLHTELKVGRGERAVCGLRGYRERFARVRWVYQPDGTRDFTNAVDTGEATLSPRKLYRVHFATGLKQTNRGRSDFFIRQKEDHLFLRHFDVSGRKNPGSIAVTDTPFDDIVSAPKSGYKRGESVLRPGAVYVFLCYDGKHYAKMEVLNITDEPPTPK